MSWRGISRISPDGLVGKEGGAEFKCPKDPKIHIDRFINGMNEKEFMPQVQGCIWSCKTDWWDWVSFDPHMPEHMRLYTDILKLADTKD